jgi:sulfate adenylyltransferase subunit 1 (EFTu-like GTPase family)
MGDPVGTSGVTVAVDKVELVDYDAGVLEPVAAEFLFLLSLEFADIRIIPVSAVTALTCLSAARILHGYANRSYATR